LFSSSSLPLLAKTMTHPAAQFINTMTSAYKFTSNILTISIIWRLESTEISYRRCLRCLCEEEWDVRRTLKSSTVPSFPQSCEKDSLITRATVYACKKMIWAANRNTQRRSEHCSPLYSCYPESPSSTRSAATRIGQGSIFCIFHRFNPTQPNLMHMLSLYIQPDVLRGLVILHLLCTKCMPILLYVCSRGLCLSNWKSDLNSLDFAVNRFFMKLFRTGDINILPIIFFY